MGSIQNRLQKLENKTQCRREMHKGIRSVLITAGYTDEQIAGMPAFQDVSSVIRWEAALTTN